jgi:hypothetical protein
MKIFLFLYLFFLSGFPGLLAQSESDYFEIRNGTLIWQKSWENHSSSDITSLFKSSGLLENIVISGNKLTGDLKPFKADFEGAGYQESKVPGYVSQKITGSMTVEVKADRYTVTIRDIKLLQGEGNQPISLASYALNVKSAFKSDFSKGPKAIYNYSFEQRLKFLTTEDKL